MYTEVHEQFFKKTSPLDSRHVVSKYIAFVIMWISHILFYSFVVFPFANLFDMDVRD